MIHTVLRFLIAIFLISFAFWPFVTEVSSVMESGFPEPVAARLVRDAVSDLVGRIILGFVGFILMDLSLAHGWPISGPRE